MKQLLWVLVALVAATALTQAADMTGKWTAEIPRTDGGTDATTFDLVVDGGKITGTVTSPVATYAIKDGTLVGEDLQFHIIVNMGREVRFLYTGTVRDEQINFIREIQGMARRVAFVAKRAQ